MRFPRPRRPALPLARGERLLAWAESTDGRQVGGTRDALYISSVVEPVETRIPWERVDAAEWDRDTSVLRVGEVGGGAPHAVPLDDPQRLLQLIRERVTASVVLQRRVEVSGKRGFRVVARRPPGRVDAGLAWMVEYDPDVDQDDPAVRRMADAELAAARADVGGL